MSQLINKISSYSLVNYLFTGVLFCFILDNYFYYSLIQEDVFVGVFLYYFVGLVISRVGSLLVEPVLKKIRFVTHSNYSDFIKASKVDEKLELLSEVNNMYRTIIALLVLIVIVAFYEEFLASSATCVFIFKVLLFISIFCLFLFSYRKQTKFILERTEVNK